MTDTVLARFTTLGGATVELQSLRFTTRYAHGHRYPGTEEQTVDGIVWQCRGCGTRGTSNVHGDPYQAHQRDKANQAANTHAASCRAA
ncbi:hypothetical protein ACFVXG_20360 [Kitasatospora sp. NPDC058162]|uniref:hypothetical protein n=1 Tax=Kitasatospora sp. NPDC058162 TaxID=3346362 RepID=UPI0036DD8BA7